MWPHLKILHFSENHLKLLDSCIYWCFLVISLMLMKKAASRGQAAQIVVSPMVFQWFREASFQRKSWKHGIPWYFGDFHEISGNSTIFMKFQEPP